MNDLYREILIKRKTTSSDTVKKTALILVVVILAAAGILFAPVILLAAIAALIAACFLIPRFNKEYEYLYVNGDFDIDVIMNRQKRKKVASFSQDDLQLVAPTGSHDLDQYSGNPSAVVRDFTSLEPDVKSYTLVYTTDGKTVLVRMELDEEIIKDLRRMAPRKISNDIRMMW